MIIDSKNNIDSTVEQNGKGVLRREMEQERGQRNRTRQLQERERRESRNKWDSKESKNNTSASVDEEEL